MSVFAQLCLLVRCALGNEPDAAAVLSDAGIDGEAVTRLALHHRVASFLHILLADPAIGPVLPCDLRQFLPVIHEANAGRNARLLRQLDGLLALLNGAGIEPVLLKGVARLVDGVYADPAARFMGDIDLLVPEAQLALADATLRAAGYRPAGAPNPNADEHHHLPVLWHEKAEACVEIHRAVVERWREALLPAGEIVARSEPAAVDGRRARLLAPPDSILHLIAHDQLQNHRFLTGDIMLSELVEGVLLARRGGTQALEAAFLQAGQAGGGLAFATFLQLCERVVGERFAVQNAGALASGPAGASLSRALARRAIWQRESGTARKAGRLVGHLLLVAELLRHDPLRFTKAGFYDNRWQEIRRLLRG